MPCRSDGLLSVASPLSAHPRDGREWWEVNKGNLLSVTVCVPDVLLVSPHTPVVPQCVVRSGRGCLHTLATPKVPSVDAYMNNTNKRC